MASSKSKKSSPSKTLVIVDGDMYLHRAYYATPKLSTQAGMPTNAIRGFMNIMMADLITLKPTHVCIVFDKGGKAGWRKEMYPAYKANRRPDPATLPAKKRKQAEQRIKESREIKGQAPHLRELIRALGFRILHKKGVEGDDLIGTLGVEYAALGYRVIMCSNDKDMAQLVGGNIHLMNADRRVMDAKAIFGKFGVRPTQIVDYLSMLGDDVDNIPGLKGVGPATASKLLGLHNTIEGIVKNRKTLTPAMRAKFEGIKDQMMLNRKLITLSTDVTHKVEEEHLAYPPIGRYKPKKVKGLCEDLELKMTYKQLQGICKAWRD